MRSNILLVTHERCLAKVYSKALCNLGFTVEWSCDEDKAIDYLAQTRHHPNLIVLDHTPTKMNGILTMIEMRRIDPSARILLMGESRKMGGFARRQGAVGFIRKPRSTEKFLRTVERYARSEGSWNTQATRAQLTGHPEKGTAVRAAASPPNGKTSSPHRQGKIWTRKHSIASALIFLALITPVISGAWALTTMPEAQAMLAVNVYSTHPLENRSFDLYVGDSLEYSGYTGGGQYARLFLIYAWDSIGSVTVDIVATSDSGNSPSQAIETVTVSPGGITYVQIYI